ncbi:MAG: tetratricopeptide repeat protein [Gammaproteobacteria bacterium]|nr:tetratricopeptide repeat protein [Gammaproteobacteria bacterium]
MNRWIGVVILLCGVVTAAQAFTWRDLWVHRDHQAKAMLDAGQNDEAAKTFQRLDWRGTAAYRAKNYRQAAQDFARVSSVDGDYNAGNALANLSQYQQAIAAYDRALAQNPKHEDALFNRKVVQNLLKQQKQQQQQQGKQKQDASQSKQSSKQQQPSSSDSEKETNQKSEQTKSDSTPPSSKPTSPDTKPEQTKQDQEDAKSDPDDKGKTATPPGKDGEQQQAKEQWLRLIPDDPGGLLREKFRRDHLKRQGERP